jgi:phage tail-like protein
MRRDVEGLRTPYPLGSLVPGFMQEDGLLVRLTTGLDDVIAPVISTVDCLDAYVDPLLAPPDFVDWLADWVGAPLDDHWSDPHRRRSVLAAVSLHARSGTVGGLRAVVMLATGGDVSVVEPGHTSYSREPTDAATGDADPVLVVRVAVDDPGSLRLAALDELVEEAKPAHLPHRIEVVAR